MMVVEVVVAETRVLKMRERSKTSSCLITLNRSDLPFSNTNRHLASLKLIGKASVQVCPWDTRRQRPEPNGKGGESHEFLCKSHSHYNFLLLKTAF